MRSQGRNRFEAEVLPHLDAAHNLARWLVRNPDTAEDVVQEAVMRALTYFARFKGVNARAWLLQIVRNAAYAAMKPPLRLVSVTDLETVQETASELSDPGDDPERALIRARDQRNMRDLLETLPAELREIIVLREIEELSYKEIAEITGAPIGTVMSRLWRARQLLTAAAGRELKQA